MCGTGPKNDRKKKVVRIGWGKNPNRTNPEGQTPFAAQVPLLALSGGFSRLVDQGSSHIASSRFPPPRTKSCGVILDHDPYAPCRPHDSLWPLACGLCQRTLEPLHSGLQKNGTTYKRSLKGRWKGEGGTPEILRQPKRARHPNQGKCRKPKMGGGEKKPKGETQKGEKPKRVRRKKPKG